MKSKIGWETNMADIATSAPQTFSAKAERDSLPGFVLEETHWGYIVCAKGAEGRRMGFAQSLSLLAGAGFLAAAAGMWLLPSIMFGTDALFTRFFSSIVFVALASLFLWYASRGTQSEIHIDNSRGEIREIVRNHTGKLSLLGCYGFDSVGGVFLEPTADAPGSNLVLRYRNSDTSMTLATGREAALEQLRERISHDVFITPEVSAGSRGVRSAA